MAQSDCGGVYLTANDFLAGKLSYPHFVKKRAKPSDDDLLNSGRLLVDRDGVGVKLDQKNIYAIKFSDGSIVRVYRDGHYMLLDPGEAVLVYKVMVYPAAKGDVMKTLYYFSKDAASDVEPLTLDNLKMAFRDNRKFENALELEFRYDSDLSAYDKIHHCYKLCRVYAAND